MNKDKRLEYLKRICDRESLNEMPFEAQDDKSIVLAAVKQSGEEFQYASPRLKADKSFFLDVVRDVCLTFQITNCWQAFKYVSDELRADKDLVLDVVSESSRAFEYASDDLKADKDFVLKVVSENWRAFKYASDELKADKDFVLDVVRENWRAFEYASDELKADKVFVLGAVRKSCQAFQYASEEVQKDKKLQKISKIYNDVGRANACDNYLAILNPSRKKPEIQNSNQDKNETPKSEIENLLIQYIQDREKERNDNQGREYNHFYAFVKRGTSASVKINAANKLLKIIRDGDNFDFNKEELKALDDGRLGNIFSRYKNTVATQPRVFTKVSI